jgi:UDP-N-acetylglucosamine/UDP-N-acetylgalactosamine diphosphorylase
VTATSTQAYDVHKGRDIHGQDKLFTHLSTLDGDSHAVLSQQIQDLDLKLLSELAELGRAVSLSEESSQIAPPDTVTLEEVRRGSDRVTAAIQRGEQELAAGRVAMLLVAGGQATRLGCDGPKGDFPVGPVSGWSLFMIHARRILAVNKRYSVRVPWYVMTSEGNDEATKEIFASNEYFGLPEADVIFFTQKMLPALDLEGNVLLKDSESLFLAPNGHGGSLEAFASSGCLDDARERGITTVSYFQVDNPLVRPSDALFLGLHCNAAAQMSSKVVQKRAADEKVGVLGVIDGKMGCIEYSDMPKEKLEARTPAGDLQFSAGNIAVHALSLDFIAQITDGGLKLPWHVAKKTIECVNSDGSSSKVDGMKFETFVFDALGLAKESVTLEVDRAEEFSPVKNRQGSDSPDTAREAMTALHAKWVSEAGLQTPAAGEDGIVAVEVDPLIAEDFASFDASLPRTPLETDDGHLYY